MGYFYTRRSIPFIEPTYKLNMLKTCSLLVAQDDTQFRFMQSLNRTQNVQWRSPFLIDLCWMIYIVSVLATITPFSIEPDL